MAGNPREHERGKGFWDGGGQGHGTNKESGGKTTGFPGHRTPKRIGVRTDLEFPRVTTTEEPKR